MFARDREGRITLAEQTGLIVPLTRLVLDAAMRQCQLWRHAGLNLPIAVNLSMANLHDPQPVETVRELLGLYSLPASSRRIEITESTLMADTARTQDVLAHLASLGVDISVDEIGTGYSSLAYPKRLPSDELIIAMSFVRHMMDDEADTAIVASAIGLGHSLGVRVVAEGVETRETWERLWSTWAVMPSRVTTSAVPCAPTTWNDGYATHRGPRHSPFALSRSPNGLSPTLSTTPGPRPAGILSLPQRAKIQRCKTWLHVTAAGRVARGASVGQHIAIIDSDPGVMTVLCELLADEGYEPHPFHTAALTVKDISALAPDAIILDVSAHGPSNGWSLMRQLRCDVALGTTPILPCSTDPSRLSGVPGFAAYHDEVLAKPFDLDDLLDRLRRLVHEAATAAPTRD